MFRETKRISHNFIIPKWLTLAQNFWNDLVMKTMVEETSRKSVRKKEQGVDNDTNRQNEKKSGLAERIVIKRTEQIGGPL